MDAHKRRMHEAEQAKQQETIQRNIEVRVRAVTEKRENRFNDLHTQIHEAEETLMRDVEEKLRRKDIEDQMKAEALYDEWSRKVFDPVQTAIQRRIDETDYQELMTRKNGLFQEYLDTVRAKGGRIFRDVIIESDYDPLKVRKQTIKVRGPKEDPVKKDLEKLMRERTLDAASSRQSSSSTGRDSLNPQIWSRTEATPYYDRTEKEEARAKARALAESRGVHTTTSVHKSSVVLDHFAYPRTYDALQAELPRGKKTFGDWKPGRPAVNRQLPALRHVGPMTLDPLPDS
eukprot:tig00020537_g10247.t1